MRAPLVLLPCVVLLIATACNTPGLARQATATDAPPALSTAPAAAREIPNPPAPTYGPTPTYVPLPGGLPRFERHPEAAVWVRGALQSLPAVDLQSTDPWELDLRSTDLSLLDLSDSGEALTIASFDTETRWPGAGMLPAGFDPPAILELGKDPGLDVRRLHAQGITGRNVGVAIIDQTLLVDHEEYANRLQVYEEADDIQGGWLTSQMHGPAVASIAVGRTVGVAPDADLYYIATAMCNTGTHESIDFACLAESVYRVLEINEDLPEGRKIRVLSISVGWAPGDKGYEEIQAATQAARDTGLLVICSSVEEVHGFRFHGLGRMQTADPNDFESYGPGVWWAEDFYAGNAPTNALLVPMGSRTTASPAGTERYAFYYPGGWSWSIPYIAGVYALAAQVRPDITPDEFWETALQTGTTIEIDHEGQTFSFGPILNPEALIAALHVP